MRASTTRLPSGNDFSDVLVREIPGTGEADSSVEDARGITSHSVERAVFSCCFQSNPNLNHNLIAV